MINSDITSIIVNVMGACQLVSMLFLFLTGMINEFYFFQNLANKIFGIKVKIDFKTL